ncbi:MAG: aldo/keto reductase [Deltaproteobacteria bacterium]|nr:aldo/keto reductase [Deltaproteobacteria bacterium]
MEFRTFGRTGLEVSALGFGGAEIGFAQENSVNVQRLIDSALDSGVNVFDSAAAYLTSERLLGEALKGRRNGLILMTKCGALDGFSRSDWSKAGILATIEQSLRNLQTDFLDVVFLHSCGVLEFLWGEAADGLRTAREKGYVRFLGYSGDGSPALEAVKSGIFDVLETSINIVDQEAITLTLPLAQERGMGVVAKRPIANAVWRHSSLPENGYHQEYWRRLQVLAYAFAAPPAAEAASTALRFTLHQPGVHTAIVGTTNPERFMDNVKSLKKGALPEKEEQSIRSRWLEAADPTWVGQV